MGIVSTASHSILYFDSVHLFLVSSIILSSKPHICANNTVQSAKNKRYSTFKVQKLHFGEFCILAFFLGGGRNTGSKFIFFCTTCNRFIKKKITRQPYPLRVRLAREI